MESWNIEKMCNFLVKHEFEEEVVGVFQQNKISGEPDMKELGLNALGDRKHLQLLIKNELVQIQDTPGEGASISEMISLVGYTNDS